MMPKLKKQTIHLKKARLQCQYSKTVVPRRYHQSISISLNHPQAPVTDILLVLSLLLPLISHYLNEALLLLTQRLIHLKPLKNNPDASLEEFEQLGCLSTT